MKNSTNYKKGGVVNKIEVAVGEERKERRSDKEIVAVGAGRQKLTLDREKGLQQ